MTWAKGIRRDSPWRWLYWLVDLVADLFLELQRRGPQGTDDDDMDGDSQPSGGA